MPEDADDERGEPVLLSALNHFLYCERRCALIHVEGVFTDNAFTVEGQLRHQSADAPGFETLPGVRVVRALTLFSRRLGLSGKADIVEFHGTTPYPVEYKRGRRKQWDNDDVQLCAQAFCLEDMFGIPVPAGAVFHSMSRRRREVSFDDALRQRTREAVESVRSLIRRQVVPPPRFRPQCAGCSLHPICLPELEAVAVARAAQKLFQTRE